MAETLRSIVHPWECDAVEHFTTAYYFQAYSSAGWYLLQLMGYSLDEMAALQPVSCRTTFTRELRAGDAYHIESGLIASEGDTLTFGHRLYNSEDGGLSATHVLVLAGNGREVNDDHLITWETETPAEIDFDGFGRWATTSRSMVRDRDLDHTGRLDLSALIHHTSDANVQFQNAIGMTSSYMAEKRIGFATFAYEIRFHDLPDRPGTVMKTDTALAHIGKSSLWFAHRVTDGMSGRPLADVAQLGVHLDRAARRASPIPEAIRIKAADYQG